jgi:large subunit ribosomal protein L25
MVEVLHVKKREERGSAACGRLRNAGVIPAVLYGHGQESMSLSVPKSELSFAIRHGSKLVEIEGDVKDSVLLREIQWDALGTDVLHVDLTRVSAEEMVEVELSLEIRGEAPGIKEGGVLDQVAHGIVIMCPAGAIPERLEVNINQLHVGQTLTAGSLELPEEAQLVTSADAVVVSCVEPIEREEIETEPGEGVEPEVIGRAASDEEES